MSSWTTLVVCLVIAASSFVQSSIGIGYAMLATAVLDLILHPAVSAAIIGFCAVVLGLAYSVRMFRHIKFRICLPPMLGMMASRALGVVTLMHMEAATATDILGFILIAFALYFWLFSGRVRIKPAPWKGFVLGILAGYLGGIYGLTGPFAAIYFYSVLDDNREYAACMNFSFLPSGVLGLIMHIYYGNITVEMLPTYALSGLAVLIGVGVGVKFVNKLNYRHLARAIYLFMAAMGIVILVI